jgi:hypothetical protein
VADEEQNLHEDRIQIDDHSADLRRLIVLPSPPLSSGRVTFELDRACYLMPVDALDSEAPDGNSDLKAAAVQKTRAEHAIDASRTATCLTSA